MTDMNLQKIENYRQFFLDEQKNRVDESKRIGKKGKSSAAASSGEDLDSIKGSFKKLAIDWESETVVLTFNILPMWLNINLLPINWSYFLYPCDNILFTYHIDILGV